MQDRFLFPLNYNYQEKFMGIIEYKILLPIALIVSIVIFILYNLKIDFFISFGIVIMVGLPPLLILSTGINGQPAIPYIKSIIMFHKKPKIYIYK